MIRIILNLKSHDKPALTSAIVFLVCFGVSITSYAQTFGASENTWNAGYYYDLNGNKITGLIDRNQEAGKSPVKHEGYFRFKSSKKADKVILSTSMVKSFVAVPDSFTISHNAVPKNTVFLKVSINESIRLYEYDKFYRSPGAGNMLAGSGTDVTLFYGSDPDSIKKLTRKNFPEAMNQILKNRPLLLNKIKNGDYSYDDLEEIINFYHGMLFEESRKKNLPATDPVIKTN